MLPSDDNVEEGHLSSGFGTTCGAWQVRDHFTIHTAVLTFPIATIWCPIYALWLSTTSLFTFHPPGAILTNETGGHHREETAPPLWIILPEEISRRPARPRRLSACDAPPVITTRFTWRMSLAGHLRNLLTNLVRRGIGN